MIRVSQIGFLFGLVILLGLVALHYTLIFVAALAVAGLIAVVLMGRG